MNMTAEEAANAMGIELLSVEAMAARFAALGYKLDRRLDCRSEARFMTGPNAGKSYPCITTGLREANTGMSAFHYQARRDSNFRAMQQLRKEIGAVLRGALLKV